MRSVFENNLSEQRRAPLDKRQLRSAGNSSICRYKIVLLGSISCCLSEIRIWYVKAQVTSLCFVSSKHKTYLKGSWSHSRDCGIIHFLEDLNHKITSTCLQRVLLERKKAINYLLHSMNWHHLQGRINSSAIICNLVEVQRTADFVKGKLGFNCNWCGFQRIGLQILQFIIWQRRNLGCRLFTNDLH